MEETISAITALACFERVISEASGRAGEMGYVPAMVERALLVGSGNDGLLMVLQLSALSEADGEFLASRVLHLNVDPCSAAVSD